VLGHKIVSVQIRLGIGPCPALWPSTPANWLPYILLILPPRRSLPFSFTTTQRSRFSLGFQLSIPCRLDRRSRPRSECSLLSPPSHSTIGYFHFGCQSSLLKISFTHSKSPVSLFVSFFYLNHVRNPCDVQILHLFHFIVPCQFTC
jgi:hypothetical protein